MNGSFPFFAWILIVCALPSWVYPDPFEDDEPWKSVFFSDNESGEEEAILQAMERAFHGRSRSFVPSTASSIDDDDGLWDRSYDDSFLSSSFYDDEDDANYEVGQLDARKRNLPIETLKRTRNFTPTWTNATVDRSHTQNKPKPSMSISECNERNKNENWSTPGLQYIPISKAYLASAEGSKVFSYTPVLSIARAGTAHKARTSPSRVTQIQDSKRQSSTNHTPKAPSPVISPWVRRFLSKCQKDVLLPVPRDFIEDNFNLVLLPEILQMDTTTFRQAWKLLVSSKEETPKAANATLESAATSLFLRLHQRFLLSHRGMDVVRRRLLASPIFGRCPLPCCKGAPLLPIGFEDYASSPSSPPRKAQRYCFTCRNLWMHWDSMVPGWAWGDSFCHLFVLEHGSEVFGLRETSKGITSKQQVVPQIFGFKLHPSANYG